MFDTVPRKILVAIESSDSEAALQYAVREMIRRGCGVHLVHVARAAFHASCQLDDISMVEGELRRLGTSVLAGAANRAQELIDEQGAWEDVRLSVSTELAHGSVVAVLQSLSRHASLVVMQHDGIGPRGDSSSLSVTAGVAASAACPVVVVPASWRPHDREHRDVLVGVGDPIGDGAVAQAGREAADSRGVAVTTVTGDGEKAVDRLLDASRDCDLVVLGRHHRKHAVGAPLGRTVRDVVRHSLVPVLVVQTNTNGSTGAPQREPSAPQAVR